MSYTTRIVLFSFTTLTLTIVLILLGPRSVPLSLVAQTPVGEEVPAGASIRMTFSRPVDRQSAEASFRLTPPASGNFFWEGQTLLFQPTQPLRAATRYRVRFDATLRDITGRPVVDELAWEFRTRPPRILLLRATEHGSELWLVDPDNQASRQLLFTAEGVHEVVAAPDGTRAIYTESRGLSRTALMLIDLDNGTTRPLVDDERSSAATPAWAPTSDLIAFERRTLLSRGEGLGPPHIWLAQPDGTLLGPLKSGEEAESSYAPTWSPNGNLIASIATSDQTLMVYSFFTDKQRELPAVVIERPTWLPDSSGLIYSSAEVDASGPVLRLRLVGIGEAPTSRGLTDGTAVEFGPVVAPQGGAVAFTQRSRSGTQSRIWLVSPDGGLPRPLSRAGPHEDTQPAWSPDGRLVAFIRSSSAATPERWAMLVDPATGIEELLLDGVVQLAWIP
jgi:Tol biopolymer transport system component